jgi:D-alanyl-D-alanine dipeptidase
MFGSLNCYRSRPIPPLDNERLEKSGYRSCPIDRTNPLYSEPASDIRRSSLTGENYYYRTDNPPYYQRIPNSIPDLLLRHSVVRMLESINNRLRVANLELYVFDAFRPIAVQNYFHDTWFFSHVKKVCPSLSKAEVMNEVEKFWAKGAPADQAINLDSPPPHSTGAAVDLTIRNKRTGEYLYMGSLFDDASEIAYTDFFESDVAYQAGQFSSVEARCNRRLLYWLMTEAGFVNNPTEWWHFSWGDQLWATISKKEAAHYSVLAFDFPVSRLSS